MGMRSVSTFRSPCEVLRKINDLCQEDSEKDEKIRSLLAECEEQIKRLSRELNKHDKKVWQNWWEKNPGWRNLLKMRRKPEYKSS